MSEAKKLVEWYATQVGVPDEDINGLREYMEEDE